MATDQREMVTALRLLYLLPDRQRERVIRRARIEHMVMLEEIDAIAALALLDEDNEEPEA